ncbi:unnamed protein product [Cunninghamella echinulata]
MSVINVFGQSILQDVNTSISRIDNDTFIIRPNINTTGLVELKIGVLLPFSQEGDNLQLILFGGI